MKDGVNSETFKVKKCEIYIDFSSLVGIVKVRLRGRKNETQYMCVWKPFRKKTT